jgi:DNA invertase Pin-like site-specific DNA recombinase
MSVEEVLEKHDEILNDWCMRHFGEVIPENNSFREIISGGETIQSRPEFQKVLRMIENKKYKAVLIKDCSRLGRPDFETIGRIINLFRYTETLIITPDYTFDLTDEFDRERLKMELEHSGWYLEAYKKLNKAGREQSVKSGWFIGSIAPYGYDKITVLEGHKRRHTLAINEREAEAVRVVFDLFVNENIGAIKIAHKMNEMGFQTRKGGLWSQETVIGILSNEHYIGKVRWNRRKTTNVVVDGDITTKRPRNKEYYLSDGRHPAIIDIDTFERAQAKRGTTPRTKDGRKLINPLAGLVYCQCGKAMVYRTYKDDKGRERSLPRLLCTNQMYCHTQSATYDDILNKVIDVLRGCIADFQVQIKNENGDVLATHAARIKRLENKYDELCKKELSLWDKYSEENMPKSVFDKLIEKVLAEKENVNTGLLRAKEDTPTVEDFKEKVCRFTDALDALTNPDASVELKNRLLKACIERIEYKRKKGTRWDATDFVLDIKMRV